MKSYVHSLLDDTNYPVDRLTMKEMREKFVELFVENFSIFSMSDSTYCVCRFFFLLSHHLFESKRLVRCTNTTHIPYIQPMERSNVGWHWQSVLVLVLIGLLERRVLVYSTHIDELMYHLRLYSVLLLDRH